MKLNELFIIILFVCFICSYQAVAAVGLDANGTNNVVLVADDTSVANQSDDILSVSLHENDIVLGAVDDGSFAALNEKINSGDSVITLENDYVYNENTDSDFVAGITISNPLSINGNGFKIDGAGLARIFNIQSGVALSNITFKNANSAGNGGALYITGNDGMLNDVTFENNYADVSGGAIFIEASNWKISNCTFNDNDAAVHGGAIFMHGSSDNVCSNINISGSTFVNNHAGLNGGAIDWHEGASEGYILNSSFAGNEAKAGNGGAVYWNGIGGEIINSSFTNNKATVQTYYENGVEKYNKSTGNGGAIMWVGSQGYINNITCTNNTADKDGGAMSVSGDSCKLYSSTFINNTAGDDGGAANWDGSRGTIYNITCIGNRGISQSNSTSKGGSICLTGDDTSIDQSSFINSFATYNGGALFITGNNVNITNSEFENCTSDITKAAVEDDQPYGGAIYIIGNHTLIRNSTFDGCAAINGGVIYVLGKSATIEGSDFTNNNAANDGAVLYVSGDDCKLANSTFISNTAGDDGAVANWEGDRGVIHNITCSDNKGISLDGHGSKGGSICLTGDNATISKSTFNDSFATYNGGALFITGSNVNITDSAFRNCSCDITEKAVGNDEPYGGAIYIIGNDTYVGSCTFEGCTAINGGVIYVSGQNAVITGSHFTTNNAAGDGGVLYVVGIDCLLANSTFINNTAGDDGGLANWVGDKGIIYNVTSKNNNGISNGTSHTKGGAICLNGNDAAIDKSSFTDSNGAYNGGAIFITGNNVNVTDTEFRNCSCDVNKVVSGDDEPYGGALYIIGSSTLVDNCTFDECSAIKGGAIYIVGEKATINDSNFTDANSTSNGGAIFVKGSDAVVNGSDFTDISAKNDGGAIYVDGKNTKVNASSFLKCSAEGKHGGAIYINNVGTNISHSNFTSSRAANAGAIYINGKNTIIEYCNLENNTATASAGAIRVHGDDTILWYNHFKYNTAKVDGGALDIGGENASVHYSSFDNNVARGCGGAINWIGGHGSDSIIGSNFTNNTCRSTNSGGGAIFWTAGATMSSGGLIKDCIFIDNTATGRHGGAIDWFRTRDSEIDNCTFIRNTAASDGGAIYSGDMSGGSVNLTISNSRFYNNTAKKHGGAIANQMANAYIYNNTFDRNKANSSGGTILIKEGSGRNSIIDHCTILNSYVHQPINLGYGEGGGAIRIGSTGNRDGDKNVTISNCLIINATTSSSYGGSISIQSNECRLDNVTIINSTSKNDQGGAIHWNANDGVITNVKIINSSTNTLGNRLVNRDVSGGAVYWTGNNAFLENVSISGAHASSTKSKDANGGAIYINSKNAHLNNIIINDSYVRSAGGDAYGGAIFLNGNNFYNMSDSLLFNNTADKGGAIYVAGSKMILNNFSLNYNAAKYGGAIYFINTQSDYNQIINSNLTYNKAIQGSGIYTDNSTFKLENDVLLDNQAHSDMFINKFIRLEDNGTYSIGATFLGFDNLLNAIWLDSSEISKFKNVTYWGVNGRVVSDEIPSVSNREIWQNITVVRQDENGNPIGITVPPLKTDENGIFTLNIGSAVNIRDIFEFNHEEDNYYTYLGDSISNHTAVKISVEDIYYGENATIKINLTDGAGNPISGIVTVLLNLTGFQNLTVDVIDGFGSINNVSGLPVGTYNASALFLPPMDYFPSADWDTFNVLPVCILKINKTAAPGSLKIGDNVIFTINVTNTGPCDATFVSVSDVLPDGFTTNSVTEIIIPKLAVGKYVVFNIEAKAIGEGKWLNVAGTYCRENITVIEDDALVVVGPDVTLSINKTVTHSNVKIGDSVVFTINVTNKGSSNATHVMICDIVSKQFNVTSVTNITDMPNSIGVIGNSISVAVDRLDVGQSFVFNITATALANGTWNNTAYANCSENNTQVNGTVAIVVNPVVNLAINKTSSLSEVFVGDVVVFTVNVTNNGPSNATDVAITDMVPSQFRVIGCNDTGYDNETHTLTVAKLDVGKSYAFTIAVVALVNGTWNNTANVVCKENRTLMNSTAFVTVSPVVNLTIDKTVDRNSVYVDEMVVFTVNVTNNGPSDATNVVVRDVLPSQFEFLAVGDSNFNLTSNELIISKLEVGKSYVFNITALALVNGTWVNVANATCDENKTVVGDYAVVIVIPAVDLFIEKYVRYDNVFVGDVVDFIIHVANFGPCDATVINVTDIVPSQFKIIYCDDENYDYSTGILVIDHLESGASHIFDIMAVALVNGTWNNTASVFCKENSTVKNATVSVTVIPVVNLTIDKTVDRNSVYVDEMVVFTVNVTNNGPSDATNVVVRDVLPSQFEFWAVGDSNFNLTSNELIIPKLGAGKSYAFSISAIALVNGTWVNVANATCDENDTVVEDYAIVTVDSVVKLVINKTVSSGEVFVGDEVVFTVNVTNDGPSVATNVVVRDVLPSQFKFDVVDDDNYNLTSNELIIPKLGAGKSYAFSISAIALVNGTWNNTAAANCTENRAIVMDTASVVVNPVVVLVANKTVDLGEVFVGDCVVFTINVNNNGPSNATNVVIRDFVPSQFEVTGCDDDNYVDNELIIAKLDAGHSYAFTITAVAHVNGIWNNTITAFCDENDTVVEDNAAVIVNPVVVLLVNKTAVPAHVKVGEVVVFIINVTNIGPSNATNVIVIDDVPMQFNVTEGTGDAVVINNHIHVAISKLDVGKSFVFNITSTACVNGTWNNTAYANCAENETDVKCTVEVAVDAVVNLAVVKSSNLSGNAKVGDLVNFTVTVINNGPCDATDVNISDVLIDAFEFVDSEGVYDESAHKVIWNLEKLENRANTTLWVAVKILVNGTFVNVASVNSSQNATVISNWTNVTALPAVDLVITKTVNASKVNVGDLIEYTITVENIGLSNATGVVVCDMLSDYVEFVKSNTSAGRYDADTGIWNIGKLENQSKTRLTLTVRSIRNGTVVNSANVTCNENSSGNATSRNVTVLPIVDVGVSKTVSSTYATVGDTITYIIYLYNNGPSDASGIIVSEILPDSVELVEYVSTEGDYDQNDGLWHVDELSRGSNATLTLKVKVIKDGIIENAVSVTSKENDTNLNNNNCPCENVTASKITTPIDLYAYDITYGEDEMLVVTLPVNATGTVNITVAGRTYPGVPICNGTVELPVHDLAGGNYDVTVEYGGDSAYLPNSTVGTFNVARIIPIITIEVEDIWAGEVEILNVTVNASGTVFVTVWETTVEIPLDNGVVTTEVLSANVKEDYKGNATWNIIALPVGTYPAFALYPGNENYTSVNTSDLFHVRDLPSTVIVTAKDIYVGEDAVIEIDVDPIGVTGDVSVCVEGKNYTLTIDEDGKATLVVSGLKSGLKNVTVWYDGTVLYRPSSNVTAFKVLKLKPPVDVDAPAISVGEDGKITVTVPYDATGTITIMVAGKTYTRTIKDGKAVFIVPDLNVGVHDIEVFYSGDEKYLSANTTGSIKVNPLNESAHNKSIPIKIGLEKYATGNPIFALLLVLLSIGTVQLRRC